MNNLRKFETLADYQAAELVYPAVSWIVSGDTVAFDKSAPPIFDIILHFNFEDVSEEKLLYSDNGDEYSLQGVEEVWVDGVKLDYVVNTHRFQGFGEHTVGIVLSTQAISNGSFYMYYNEVLEMEQYIEAYKIEFGSRITTIDAEWMFDGLLATTMVLGENVTTVSSLDYGEGVLTELTCLATTPPTISDGIMPRYIQNIYVQAEALNAYMAAPVWSNYTDRIQAIQ